MNSKFAPARVGAGTVLQAGIPKRGVRVPLGLYCRGVVVVTYVADDDNHPLAAAAATPAVVYCDVLTYGREVRLLRNCLVSQPHGSGLQRGKVWKPRAAKLDVTGNTLDLDQGSNPANLDGDHVLVTFIDDNPNQPVIVASLPHPRADIGREQDPAGQRLRLKVADGDPDFWKHRGCYYGVSDDGDFVVDTTKGFAADLGGDGKEPTPPGDGSTGNQRYRLPAGSKLYVEVDGGATVVLENKDGSAKLTVGDGAKSVAISETLESFYGSLKTYIEGAKVPTAMGLSGTIMAGSGAAPTWDAAIKSTKVKIPNG